MAAALHPEEVACAVFVSSSRVSVAEQQIHKVEAAIHDVGFSTLEGATASLVARLLINWQLAESAYRGEGKAAVQTLTDGPRADFATLACRPAGLTPAGELAVGIEILGSMADEPWAEFLHLSDIYLPMLRAIAPDQMQKLTALAGRDLLLDPAPYLSRVRCSVPAFFGVDDVAQPTGRSAALFEQYLTVAGNEHCDIVVIPGVGHNVGFGVPAYGHAPSGWLARLYSEWRPAELTPPPADRSRFLRSGPGEAGRNGTLGPSRRGVTQGRQAGRAG